VSQADTNSRIDTVAVANPAEGRKAGVVGSLAQAVFYAALFASGAIAVDGVLLRFSGSFLTLGTAATVAAFWASVAVLAAAGLWIVLLPAILLTRGTVRRVILPTVVITAGFSIHTAIVRTILAANDPIGGAIILHPAFGVVWGVVLALAAAFVAKRAGGRYIAVYSIAIAGILFSSGVSAFVGHDAGAFILAFGPVLVLALGGPLVEHIRSGFARAAAAIAVIAVCGGALYGVAYVRGEHPLGPVMRPLAVTKTPAPGSPNVVIIVVDTMRASHTSLYGYKYPTTPNLKELAADSRFFPNAVTVDSCTLPAHSSMFTGMLPREHGAHASGMVSTVTMERARDYIAPLDPSRTTLATYLARGGYNTAGIVSNYARLCRQLGLSQGFSYYYDLPRFLLFSPGLAPAYKYAMEQVDTLFGCNGWLVKGTWHAEDVTSKAESWVRDNADGTPFFLFLNYMEAHHPYSAPGPYSRMDGEGIAYNPVMRLTPWLSFIRQYQRTGKGLDDNLLRQIENQYDGGIAYADHWMGELIRNLKANGLYDNTLIIVTSDHGEFFGEHGMLTHSVEIYEEGVEIPIIVKYPHSAHGGEVRRERVSIMDIFATVLDVTGQPIPPVTSQPLGKVTHPIMVENYNQGVMALRSNKPQKRVETVIYDGDYKYIHASTGANELYDLRNDPREASNLVKDRPEISGRLEKATTDWLARTGAFVPGKPAVGPAEPEGAGTSADRDMID